MRVKIDLKPVKSIRDLQEDTSLGWKRRIGQLYFQVLEDGQVIPRVITTATNGDWITKMIREGKLYIPEGGSVCELE